LHNFIEKCNLCFGGTEPCRIQPCGIDRQPAWQPRKKRSRKGGEEDCDHASDLARNLLMAAAQAGVITGSCEMIGHAYQHEKV